MNVDLHVYLCTTQYKCKLVGGAIASGNHKALSIAVFVLHVFFIFCSFIFLGEWKRGPWRPCALSVYARGDSVQFYEHFASICDSHVLFAGKLKSFTNLP